MNDRAQDAEDPSDDGEGRFVPRHRGAESSSVQVPGHQIAVPLDGVVAQSQDRELPHVGWPTMVLPPPGVHVTGFDRGEAATIIVTSGSTEATARLDLETRETLVSASGDAQENCAQLRRLALTFVADRNDFDERGGEDVHPAPPTFDERDPNTWTSMQVLADVTSSDWYPPEPSQRTDAAWATFFDLARRFNDRPIRARTEATMPRSNPLRAARSSVDPAMPDPSAPAAE